jgi:hypothetical protein
MEIAGSQLVLPGGFRAVGAGGSRIVTAGPCAPCCDEGYECGLFSLNNGGWNILTNTESIISLAREFPASTGCGGPGPNNITILSTLTIQNCTRDLRIQMEIDGTGVPGGNFNPANNPLCAISMLHGAAVVGALERSPDPVEGSEPCTIRDFDIDSGRFYETVIIAGSSHTFRINATSQNVPRPAGIAFSGVYLISLA